MRRRLLTIWTNPLFRESMRLILDHPDVEWVGSSADYGAARELARELQPDIIVVEEIDGSMPACVLEVLEEQELQVRLVGVNLVDNRTHIYRCEELLVATTDELVRLVLQ